MLAKVTSCALVGLEGATVQVEVDISPGLPSFTIVGLPDKAVQESRERVRAAIKNSGFPFPMKRLTVNLAPADLPKEGPAYDLPIAIGLLNATQPMAEDMRASLFVGELSLDGKVCHVDGVLPMTMAARDSGHERIYVPAIDAPEAALMEGVNVIPVESLVQLVKHLQGEENISPYQPDPSLLASKSPEYSIDFSHIRGQEHVKRALEVAAAGGHNVLVL